MRTERALTEGVRLCPERGAGAGALGLLLKMGFLNGLNPMEHPKGGRQVSFTTMSDRG